MTVRRVEMKDKELLKIMQKNGWKIDRINGSHHVMKKGNQTEVIPVHGKEISTGIANKILKRIGLK